MRISTAIMIAWAIIWGGFSWLVWMVMSSGDPHPTASWFEWTLYGWLPVGIVCGLARASVRRWKSERYRRLA